MVQVANTHQKHTVHGLLTNIPTMCHMVWNSREELLIIFDLIQIYIIYNQIYFICLLFCVWIYSLFVNHPHVWVYTCVSCDGIVSHERSIADCSFITFTIYDCKMTRFFFHWWDIGAPEHQFEKNLAAKLTCLVTWITSVLQHLKHFAFSCPNIHVSISV